MDELMKQRVTLLDLLVGRSFRLEAGLQLEGALTAEKWGLPQVAADGLVRAAHWEWIASIAERGTVRWGARFNRCGYQSEFGDE